MDSALADLAQAQVDGRSHAGARIVDVVAAALNWDDAYCRRVAGYYEQAPLSDFDAALADRYREFQRETLEHFRLVSEAGIEVRPWRGPGQPYRTSAELRAAVRETGVLHVYLTSTAHGPGTGRTGHPMAEPSGVVAGGAPLCHNDIFRAVHDVFGHVLSGSGFSPRGEFRASFCHLSMYSEPVHPVLFTEQIAQICWYFYGPHAARRRYPEQKVFAFPAAYVEEFRALFTLEQVT
ncbi:crotonobetainyl-CoA--carnitine CoA-transferase [Amycolatopsis silviterrae]|uniref:Crotonobetainyl-CoA--carnitine CoA-transferase n=1 Tax=Amycolatopsis silviterrae TaxID=1656914 RepID=A0ABW5HGV4_9PSEU